MEANVARCSCTHCSETLLHLIWYQGKRYVILECHECGTHNTFNLETMIEALGSQDVYQTMLESFQPRGLPS